MLKKIKLEYRRTKEIFVKLPTILTSLYILTLILMNLFASKEINLGVDWAALDCGILVSWYMFFYSDIITRNFGPKPAIKIAVFAIVVSLFVSFIFFIVANVPGNWSQFYIFNNNDVNIAINNTLQSNWYVVFGGTVAFLVASITNALLNYAIGKMFRKYSLVEFILRSYISTLISQFIDNFIFAVIVSHIFFGWSLTQCIVCALIGCIFESLCELVFCPLGYAISEKYRKKSYIKGV